LRIKASGLSAQRRQPLSPVFATPMNDVSTAASGPAEPILETAAQHLAARVVRAHADESVAQVLARLPGNNFDVLDAVYVLDSEERLQGLVRLRTLYAAAPAQALGAIMEAPPPKVRLEEDQERVASLAIRARLTSVPVVDQTDRLLGAVPPEALMDILRREHIEDLHRIVGIREHQSQAVHALSASPLQRARTRLPWLLVGFAGSVVATFVMTRFEAALAAQVAIAFFVPGIVYLADAIGTQSEAVAVRGLSFNHASLRHLIAGEFGTGLLIGLCLGLPALPVAWYAFGNLSLALAVTASIVVAGTTATSIGLFLPWLLSRAGMDPALGSGPVATIIQDVLSLLVYFSLVTVLVM